VVKVFSLEFGVFPKGLSQQDCQVLDHFSLWVGLADGKVTELDRASNFVKRAAVQSYHVGAGEDTLWLYHKLKLFRFYVQIKVTFIRVLSQITEADVLAVLVRIDWVVGSVQFKSYFAFFDLLDRLFVD
jgi:hypothetical protein